MAGWFELKKSGDKWMFNLKAGNAETILTSQRYASRSSAQNGIASIQKNCGDDSRFEPKVASSGKFYFTIKAKNSQVIGQSQMYATERSRDNGIASVKKNGASNDIRDKT